MREYVFIPKVQYQASITSALYNDILDNIKVLMQIGSWQDRVYLEGIKDIISPHGEYIEPHGAISSRLLDKIEMYGSCYPNGIIYKMDDIYKRLKQSSEHPII